ncbi:unnamed protein product, partial [Ectocarpus sp. 12 AP-2014]
MSSSCTCSVAAAANGRAGCLQCGYLLAERKPLLLTATGAHDSLENKPPFTDKHIVFSTSWGVSYLTPDCCCTAIWETSVSTDVGFDCKCRQTRDFIGVRTPVSTKPDSTGGTHTHR